MAFSLDTPAPANHLKRLWADGGVAASMIVRMARGPEIAKLAASGGMDTLYVDMEHSTLSFDVVSAICMAAQDAGVTPMVRLAENTASQATRALDGGAMGIIVPHVQSADDARRAVALAKYPPLGERSHASGLPHFGYRPMPADQAMATLNLETLVVVMVESRAAVEAVEAIAAVAGVDMLLIGAGDLSADLGLSGHVEHSSVDAAICRVIDAALAVGKVAGLGGLAQKPDLLSRYVMRGARYVSTGTDQGFLLGAITAKAESVRRMTAVALATQDRGNVKGLVDTQS